MISPKFEQFSTVYTGITFVKIDVDAVPEVAEQAGIRAMPTFQVYQAGNMVEELVGADPKKLEDVIKKYA
jgi:thioredoxin 1